MSPESYVLHRDNDGLRATKGCLSGRLLWVAVSIASAGHTIFSLQTGLAPMLIWGHEDTRVPSSVMFSIHPPGKLELGSSVL